MSLNFSFGSCEIVSNHSKAACGVSKIHLITMPWSQQHFWCCSEPPSSKRRTALFDHYRTAASAIPSKPAHSTSAPQLHWYLSVINSAAVDPMTDEESRMDKLIIDFPLLRPVFARVFCVPASSASIERMFSQSGIIMSARRARMSNSLFEALVLIKCSAHL